MTPEMSNLLSQALVAFGAFVAFGVQVLRWLDNRSQRQAILESVSEEVRDKLKSLPPISGWVVFVATGLAMLSLALGMDMRALAVAKVVNGRQCSTSAQCETGQRCERGVCVGDARKPKSTATASSGPLGIEAFPHHPERPGSVWAHRHLARMDD